MPILILINKEPYYFSEDKDLQIFVENPKTQGKTTDEIYYCFLTQLS